MLALPVDDSGVDATTVAPWIFSFFFFKIKSVIDDNKSKVH